MNQQYINFFAVIGAVTTSLFILVFFILPIMKTLVFATGYTIIMILNIDMKKVAANPVHAVYQIIIRFKHGIIVYLTSIGEITDCRYGNWHYYPLLKIKR